jgi:peptide deformylase
MTVRPLRLLGDPVLRTPCDQVTRFDDVLAQLVADLVDTVQEPGRAGVAATQIGVSLAAFAYNVDGQLGYLINPRIVEATGSQDGELARCLQHESDHLHGELYIDKLAGAERRRVMRDLRRYLATSH